MIKSNHYVQNILNDLAKDLSGDPREKAFWEICYENGYEVPGEIIKKYNLEGK